MNLKGFELFVIYYNLVFEALYDFFSHDIIWRVCVVSDSYVASLSLFWILKLERTWELRSVWILLGEISTEHSTEV